MFASPQDADIRQRAGLLTPGTVTDAARPTLTLAPSPTSRPAPGQNRLDEVPFLVEQLHALRANVLRQPLRRALF